MPFLPVGDSSSTCIKVQYEIKVNLSYSASFALFVELGKLGFSCNRSPVKPILLMTSLFVAGGVGALRASS